MGSKSEADKGWRISFTPPLRRADSIVIHRIRLTGVCLCFSVCVRLRRKAVFAISVDNEAINLTVCGPSTRCFILFQTLKKKGKKIPKYNWLIWVALDHQLIDFQPADKLKDFWIISWSNEEGLAESSTKCCVCMTEKGYMYVLKILDKIFFSLTCYTEKNYFLVTIFTKFFFFFFF